MRILIAEDSALFREGLARLLTEAGHEVRRRRRRRPPCWTPSQRTSPTSPSSTSGCRPTMTIDGARAARHRSASQYPHLPILLLSQHIETRQLSEPGRLGRLRLPPQGPGPTASTTSSTPSAGSRRRFRARPRNRRRTARLRRPHDPLAALTPREHEVLALVAEGRSNAADRRRLVLAERTVETHMRSIFQKLRIPDTGDTHRRVLAVLAYLSNTARPQA